MSDITASLETAKSLLSEAEAVLITAGAGMGVDSGLPDFRGTEGFWRAYPPYQKLGKEFMSVANPKNFYEDPAFAWGFYGHRYNLYRETKPHAGFEMLLNLTNQLPGGGFVFTSNVDGHFETAGFNADQVVECHGSINYYQCLSDCCNQIYSTEDWDRFEIDETDMTAAGPLPTCPDCGNLARPAILMFGDMEWNGSRTTEQEGNFRHWLDSLAKRRIAVIEMGAGKAIPTVRHQSELIAEFRNAFLIRINPRESEIPYGIDGVELPIGALDALQAILA